MKILGENVATHLAVFTSQDALGISFDVQDHVVMSLVQPIRHRGADRIVTNFPWLRHNIQRGINRSLQESLSHGQGKLPE